MKIKNLFVLSTLVLTFVGCGSSTSAPQRDASTTGIKSTFMNATACDVIIDKQFLEICYDYDLKAAKSVAYPLAGDLVNELNIRERLSFYEELELSNRYRVQTSDYTRSGYDRGHMAPDAAFDWSAESLEATYSLANIIPQIKEVNRDMWVDAESYARAKAVELGAINVINVVKYASNPKRIGTARLAVSEGFYKILYNEDDDYKECYYYANQPNPNSLKDKLSSHKVDCNSVSY